MFPLGKLPFRAALEQPLEPLKSQTGEFPAGLREVGSKDSKQDGADGLPWKWSKRFAPGCLWGFKQGACGGEVHC